MQAERKHRRSSWRATDFGNEWAARNDFVGSTLQINGQPYTVIGITPEGFSGASALIAPDIWLPLGMHSQLGSAFGDSETMHDLMQSEKLRVQSRRPDASRPDDRDRRNRGCRCCRNDSTPSSRPMPKFTRELQIQTPSRFSLSTSARR